MPGNGKVFISHSHDDNERCKPLLAALDAWGVDYWFDTQGLTAGQHLTERIQKAIGERDIFLRICTAATQASFWMSLEANAFRGLQAEAHQRGRGHHRLLVNLILDGDYSREPFDNATLFIDAASRPRQVWLADLARALDVRTATAARRVSRRGVVIALSAAAAVTVSSSAAAIALLADAKARTTPPKLIPGKVAWQLTGTSPKKDVPPASTVEGSSLYVSVGSRLTAYDLNDIKHPHWHVDYTPQFGFNSPAIVGGVVYNAVDSSIYALNAHDGSKRWTANLDQSDYGSVDSTPVVEGGAFYVLSETGLLYAFSTHDGSKIWSKPLDQSAYLVHNASGPTVAAGTIYIGATDHNVYAFNAHDGSPKWKFLTRGKIWSTPQVANGLVFVGSADGYVYALHASDGSVAWKYYTPGDVYSTPAIVDGVVYIGSNDRHLYALDAATGTAYWRAPVGDLDASTGVITNSGGITCQPAVTGDAVVVVDDINYNVRAYTRHDGSPRWVFKSTSFFNADPYGANGLVIYGSGDQNLYAFDA